MNAFPLRAKQAEVVVAHVRLLGTGASAPTVEEGVGVTATRTGTGAYTLTWDVSPGRFLTMSASVRAATPANVAGHTVIGDTYASKALPIVLGTSDGTAHDLAAAEYIDVVVSFARTTA